MLDGGCCGFAVCVLYTWLALMGLLIVLFYLSFNVVCVGGVSALSLFALRCVCAVVDLCLFVISCCVYLFWVGGLGGFGLQCLWVAIVFAFCGVGWLL